MMMDKAHSKAAVKEGRVCSRCGWMINKKRWKDGKRLCVDCEYALSDFVVKGLGYGPARDDKQDLTGEMI